MADNGLDELLSTGQKIIDDERDQIGKDYLIFQHQLNEVYKAWNQLEVDYEDLNVDKALSDCSPCTFDYIQYQQEIITSSCRLNDVQSKLIANLLQRVKFMGDVSNLSEMYSQTASYLEKQCAVYSAKKDHGASFARKGADAKNAKY
ncbi:hypothetical protein [Methylotenera sp.]|uniref:hypothetical protein n=1 Tax=Methylotenera sp. TaxID=2051956 RepID=UPI00248A7B66|nr:hypothetical protein [Methylotenera sp.]MDI1298139.1 hypothetical protein [Methylotenera sp.]